jgi:hypothetical protein
MEDVNRVELNIKLYYILLQSPDTFETLIHSGNQISLLDKQPGVQVNMLLEHITRAKEN